MIEKGVILVQPKSVEITPSSTASPTAASNMLHDEKALVWRSTGTAGQYLTFRQTGAFDVVALVGTNRKAGDQVRIRVASTLSGLTSSPAIDTTIAAFSGNAKSTGSMVLYRLAAPVSHEYVRIDFVSSSGPDPYVEVSNVIIGLACEWDGVDAGAEITYRNQATSYLRKFRTTPEWKFTLSGISTAYFYNVFEPFLDVASEKGGFLFVPVYNDEFQQQRSAYVSMSADAKQTINNANDINLEMTVITIQ